MEAGRSRRRRKRRRMTRKMIHHPRPERDREVSLKVSACSEVYRHSVSSVILYAATTTISTVCMIHTCTTIYNLHGVYDTYRFQLVWVG